MNDPVRIAIAHNKSGVSKTTSTFVLGRYLSRTLRVEMVDLDRTRYLTEVVTQLSPVRVLPMSFGSIPSPLENSTPAKRSCKPNM